MRPDDEIFLAELHQRAWPPVAFELGLRQHLCSKAHDPQVQAHLNQPPIDKRCADVNPFSKTTHIQVANVPMVERRMFSQTNDSGRSPTAHQQPTRSQRSSVCSTSWRAHSNAIMSLHVDSPPLAIQNSELRERSTRPKLPRSRVSSCTNTIGSVQYPSRWRGERPVNSTSSLKKRPYIKTKVSELSSLVATTFIGKPRSWHCWQQFTDCVARCTYSR